MPGFLGVSIINHKYASNITSEYLIVMHTDYDYIEKTGLFLGAGINYTFL